MKLLIDHRQPTLSMQESAFHETHHFDFSVLAGVGFESKHTLVQQKFRSGALKSGPYTARLSKCKTAFGFALFLIHEILRNA